MQRLILLSRSTALSVIQRISFDICWSNSDEWRRAKCYLDARCTLLHVFEFSFLKRLLERARFSLNSPAILHEYDN